MRILAIDISHLFRRTWEASGGKELSEAFERTIRTVASIREGYDRVVILCDAGMSFRKAIDPAYKADRERPPAPFYEQQTRTIDRLRDDGCSVFYAPAVSIANDPRHLCAEADDLCASIAEWCIRHRVQEEIHEAESFMALDIYSGDKSLLQLVDDEHGIRIINPDSGPQTAESVIAKFGIPPAKVVDMLGLAGKAGDNYKPFPGWTDAEGKHNGIGEKTAVSMVIEHGSAINAVAMLDARDENDIANHGYKPAIYAALSRGLPTPSAAVLRGLNLATLRRDLEVDFSPLLAEPVWASIASDGITRDSDDAQAQSEVAEHFAGHDEANGDSNASAIVPRAASGSAMTRFGEQYRSADAMMSLANRFYESRMFGSFPNADSLFLVMWLAHERGEDVGHALINSYVTKVGKPPGYLATYRAARVKASRVCKVFRIVETERDHAIVEYQRIDDEKPGFYRFDLQEAIDAGWDRDSKDSPWKTRPRAMCRAAALRECAKAFFFDVDSGMTDADEEYGQ